MAEVVFDFVANPEETVLALNTVDNAVEKFSESTAEYFARISKEVEVLQVEAKRTTSAAQNVVPDFRSNIGPLQLVNGLLRQMGVETGYLSAALRTLSITNRLAASSTNSLTLSVAGLRTAITGLLASIPVVGWLLLGVTAAAMATSKAFKFFKEEAENAKKATDAFNESQKTTAKIMEDVNISLLEEQGKLYEAKKAKIEQSEKERNAAYIKELVEQKQHLSEMNLSIEEFNKKNLELDAAHREAVFKSHDLMNAQLKNLEEQRVKDAKEAADREDAVRRNSVAAMQNAVEDELTYLGLESGALVERKLLAAGASEEEAKRTGELKNKVDALKKAAEIEKSHVKTVQELTFETQMNTAILEDNAETQKELNIQKRLAAGLTREQAEEEVGYTETIKEQEKAIKEKNEAEEKARRINESHADAMERLGDQYSLNSTRLNKDTAAEKEALITQRMRIGLTREQAVAELAAEEATRKQEDALRKLQDASSQFVGLDQMYKNIQASAASANVDKGSLFADEAKAAGMQASSGQGSAIRDDRVIDVLGRIFGVMDDIRNMFPKLGGLA